MTEAETEELPLPESLAPIRAFLNVAQDLGTSDYRYADVIVFCIRRYAIHKVMKNIQLKSLPDVVAVENFLNAYMNKLEGDKLMLKDKYSQTEEGNLAVDNAGWGGNFTKHRQLEIVSEYALLVYTQAEDEYERGVGTRRTVQKFYKAAHLFEVCHENNIEFLLLQKKCQLKVGHSK